MALTLDDALNGGNDLKEASTCKCEEDTNGTKDDDNGDDDVRADLIFRKLEGNKGPEAVALEECK